MAANVPDRTGSGHESPTDGAPDEKDTDMKHKLIAVLLAGGLLAGAAACKDEAKSASSGKHARAKVTCHRITAKAHVQGTGNYSLTLKGRHNPVRVPKPAYMAVGIGDEYCTNK